MKTLREKIKNFWGKVDQSSTCWEWKGPKAKNGYGTFSGLYRVFKTTWAHRLAYLITRGPIPPGLEILHSCDHRSCVNPDHLSLGTRKENMRQASERGKLFHWTRPRGESNLSSKLTEMQVKQVIKLSSEGYSKNQICKEFNISRCTVHRLTKGKSWKHLRLESLPDKRRKLSEQDYIEIVKLKGKITQAKIAHHYGVSRSLIGIIHAKVSKP